MDRRGFFRTLMGSTTSLPTGQPTFNFRYSEHVPALNTEQWSLTVHGLIEGQSHIFNWSDIQALPGVDMPFAMACIGSPVGGKWIGQAVWQGVRLRDLLAQVQIKPQATRARLIAADGYQTGVDLAWLAQPDTLLAYAINGQPLTHEQGFPARLLIPGLYGQKMPKWIQRMELVAYPFRGYWESRGWSDIAEIQTCAWITYPTTGTRLTGKTRLHGYALAGRREITQVEVRFDGGQWLPAVLQAPASPHACTPWSLDWQPDTPGMIMIEVRATDSSGMTQSEIASPRAYPNGTAAIQQVVVHVAESA